VELLLSRVLHGSVVKLQPTLPSKIEQRRKGTAVRLFGVHGQPEGLFVLVSRPFAALLVAGDLSDVTSVFGDDSFAEHRVVAVERLWLLLSLRGCVVNVVEEVISAG